MPELTVPPPPSAPPLPSHEETMAIAEAARDLAMKFADAADNGPDEMAYPAVVVLTALQVFTASVMIDCVPEVNYEETLTVMGNGVRHRLTELKQLLTDEQHEAPHGKM